MMPDWIRVRYSEGRTGPVADYIERNGVVTVCEGAACPNRWTCYANGELTFMILGQRCTRRCGFCGVSGGVPEGIDGHECRTILDAVRWLGTDYAVVTSVTRDDLPDGGAGQFAEVVGSLRGMGCRVEVLVPDFRGNEASIGTVLGAGPDVVGHNMETTADLYTAIRPMSDYAVGLSVLETIKRLDSDMPTKSGFMLGLGESMTGVKGLMQDIRSTGCDMLTIGQYLRPSSENVEVREYVRPEVFGMLEEYAYSLGFRAVRASPLSRSSLGAREMWLRTANSRTFYDEKQEKEDVC